MEHTCAGMYDVCCKACWALWETPISDEERNNGLPNAEPLSSEEIEALWRDVGGEG